MTQPFRYVLGHGARGCRPGSHRSTAVGAGLEFHAHRRLIDDPDPRRLDLLASCRDPLGELQVRVLRERRAAAIQVIADVSASVGFAGIRRKLDVLADFTAAAALSAHQVGDAFGFLGADATVREDLRVAPTRVRGAGMLLADRLRRFVPGLGSAAGLGAAAAELGHQRALVFLVSDFHLPDELLDRVLTTLARHTVVPVVLWDPGEYTWSAAGRITAARDLETGRLRTLFMRPALRAKIRAAFALRRSALTARFAMHGRRPLFLLDGFEAERVTRYFLDPGGRAGAGTDAGP